MGMVYEEAFATFMRGVVTKNSEDITAAYKIFPEIKSLGLDLTTLKMKLLNQ